MSQPSEREREPVVYGNGKALPYPNGRGVKEVKVDSNVFGCDRDINVWKTNGSVGSWMFFPKLG